MNEPPRSARLHGGPAPILQPHRPLRLRAGLVALCLGALGAPRLAHSDEPQGASPEARASGEAQPIEVTVLGNRAATAGYRLQTADLGPLGIRSTLDLPFAVYGAPESLLRSQMIHQANQVMRFIPSLQMEARFGMEFGPAVIRGFEVDDNSENTRIDGLNVRADTALPVDLYETYEVLTGPAGSLYGPTCAGGMINAALKRPPERAFQEVSLQLQGSSHASLQADAGGRFGPDQRLGYRVVASHASGGLYAPGSNLERELGAIALDARLPARTVLELLASEYDFREMGNPGGFAFGGTTGSTGLPAAPSPRLSGLGASWAGMQARTRLLEVAVRQRVIDDLGLEAGILQQIADREFHNMMSHTFTDDAGDYATTYRQSGSRGNVLSNKLYVNGAVATGFVRHQIALGTNGFRADAYSKPQVASGTLSLGPGSLSSPVLGSEPGWISPGPQYKTSRTTVQSAVLNDTLSLGPKLSVMVGGSLGWIHTRNFNAAGTQTSQSGASAQLSGAASVSFKPRGDMTVYANYADSIQPGESAPACSGDASRDLVNCGQTLAPERSQQLELGYRWAVTRQLDLSAAAFRIRRPFAYVDAATRTFELLGAQVNNGLELHARGNASRGLTVVAGLTLLDPKLIGTPSAATAGKQVVGVPAAQGNLLLEYRLPWLQGLAVHGAVHGRSRVPGDPSNASWARGWATVDGGVRYGRPVLGATATADVGVSNLGNASYWASVRGSLSGDPAGSSAAFLGTPRLWRFGLRIEL